VAIAPIRPASTIVVLRPAGDTFEVLLVRRNDKVAFMAGAYVFPGGRVDDDDAAAAAALYIDPAVIPARFSDLSPDEELRHRVAAVRELEEEAAVRVAPEALVPFAHWLTPEIEIRRYDTRFFVVRMPDGQEARHDDVEMTALEWLTPAEAAARFERAEINLPPPTWTTLRQLAAFSTIDDVVEWASRRSIVRVQPGFYKTEQQTMLTLPGDPTYPTIEGWDVPEYTRFLLQDGRWRPVRP
jgi:8-oxo-dGTP pyrophosphatase MutT (NUDIX family)